MTILDRCRRRLTAADVTVVLPEGDDPRIAAAALELARDALANSLLIAQDAPEARARIGRSAGAKRVRVIDANDPETVERYAPLLAGRRKSMSAAMVRRALRKPLFLGGAVLAAGDADAWVGGVAHTTRRAIEAALLTVGLADGIALASTYYLMSIELPRARGRRELLFADCSAVIDPTAEQLADIAIASAVSAAGLFDEPPRVALLSASTHNSAPHARSSKVRQATEIARRKRPDLLFDGELQVDAALSLGVAAKKLDKLGEVGGRANVLVFPDLDSGNIAYKLLQQFADASAIGSIFQGLGAPVADLSRGASVEDIVATAILALASSRKALSPRQA